MDTEIDSATLARMNRSGWEVLRDLVLAVLFIAFVAIVGLAALTSFFSPHADEDRANDYPRASSRN